MAAAALSAAAIAGRFVFPAKEPEAVVAEVQYVETTS